MSESTSRIEPTSRASGEDIFVVSNLGQARNAATLARTSDDARIVVVGTASAAWTADIVERYCRWHGLMTTRMTLPDDPTTPSPSVIGETMRRYRALVSASRPSRVWLANTNAHYGVLAALSAESGASLCYFEEGLGSYRRASDPVFRPYERSLVKLARHQFSDVGVIVASTFTPLTEVSAGRVQRNVRTLCARTAANAVRWCAAFDVYRWAIARRSGREAAQFFVPWKRFDRAAVAFPELIDRGLIDANVFDVLDLEPWPAEVDRADDWLEAVGVRSGCVLFVSQPYGDRGVRYYGSVADRLATAGLDDVVVQCHPREREYSRVAIREAFARAGVRAQLLERAPVTAEAMLATGRFRVAAGVTSTTLVYASTLFASVDVFAFGRSVLDALATRRASPGGLDTLRGDVDVFEFVMSTRANGPHEAGPARPAHR